MDKVLFDPDSIAIFQPFPGLEHFAGKGLVLEFEPVGSRVTCNPPPTHTDEDWLVLVGNAMGFVGILVGNYGFESAGSEMIDRENDWDRDYAFTSLRLGPLNLIVTDSDLFYRNFLAASSVAKRLNLMDKADRVALFQAVLYGNAC